MRSTLKGMTDEIDDSSSIDDGVGAIVAAAKATGHEVVMVVVDTVVIEGRMMTMIEIIISDTITTIVIVDTMVIDTMIIWAMRTIQNLIRDGEIVVKTVHNEMTTW